MFDRDDYAAFIQKVKTHTYYPYAMVLLRGGAQYAAYALMAYLTVPRFRSEFLSTADGAIAMASYFCVALELVLLGLMLNSVLLTFSIYHRIDRERFLKAYTQDTYDAKAEKKRLVRDPLLWLEISVLWLLFALFPVYGYRRMFVLLPFLSISPLLQHVILIAVFAVASFLILMYTRLDARNYWFELPGRLMKHRVWMSMSKKKERKYGFVSFLLRLLGYALLYWFALPMVTMVVAVLISMLGIVTFIVITPLLFVPILLVIACFYIHALRYRRKFVKKLKKLCKEQGFELFDCKHPYRSIFHDSKGYTFGITANGKTYYCRLIASVKRGNRMILDDEGSCTRIHTLLRTFQARLTRAGGFVQAEMPTKDEDRDVLSFTSVIDYRFEADGEKVLILNPVAKKVLRKIQNTTREVDNGDRIGGYWVYTGNAFLRGLESDRIGKGERKDPYKWI